jgi:hypothetical protein
MFKSNSTNYKLNNILIKRKVHNKILTMMKITKILWKKKIIKTTLKIIRMIKMIMMSVTMMRMKIQIQRSLMMSLIIKASRYNYSNNYSNKN